ncbi:MAG TPA: hypothetical protein VGN81_00650 [Pseudonocardiaceae bacterium]
MPIPGAVGRVHGTVMLVEAVSFAVAAVVHLGHRIGPVSGELATGTAVVELIMAGLVGLGALAVLTGALRARLFAFLVTLLAVIGVIYQLVTISLATGPRTIPDLGFDIAMMAVLLISLAVLTNRRRYD